MHLTGLSSVLRESVAYRELVDTLQSDHSQTWPVVRAARPFVLATLAQRWPGSIIYLTGRGKRAHNIAEQLPVWLDTPERVYRFAEPTPMFYDRLPWDKTVVRDRLETLQALLLADESDTSPVVIASARALMQRTMPVNEFLSGSARLEVGQRHSVDKLLSEWVSLGYEPVTMVIEPGTFSRRGGILDVFPVAARYPVRVEFFGDEIDTLRTFDPGTQRTIKRVKGVAMSPAREALPERMPGVARYLSGWFESLSDTDDVTRMEQDYDALSQARVFGYLEHYLPYIYENPVSLLDYAPSDALIVVDDWGELQHTIEQITQEAEGNRETNLTAGQLPPEPPVPYVAWETLAADLEFATTLHLGTLSAESEAADVPRLFSPGERFGGQLRPALNKIRQYRQDGERVVVVTQQIERLESLWYEQDASAFVPKADSLADAPEPGQMVFVRGELSEGWTFAGGERPLHLITDAEIFGWSRPEPRRRQVSSSARRKLPEADYNDWNDGDYVVHVDYGIGRFKGLQPRTIEGNEREYLIVQFAENGLLFVPIHQADRLTRYVGPDETPPKLSSLGKQDAWVRTRKKAQKNAEEEARELLKIYAKRAKASGHAFASDTPWQHELEASFPYVETDDQLIALRDVKRDMETHMPMDRLVCGDVGYGKTEVALRAAFKAVMDGKQVAVLVPTTVLADQHYKTFSRRMQPFPVNVEMLSRFRTKAQQNKIVTDLANGNVDIIIGTHRILSNDITLQNLGLIIIDEEQRFGVKHKEHFKRMRASVDILTLTATPIPRTLYMSLSGVRDISMIQTPPEERLPVITHVGNFDPRLVRQAVLREVDRGGQVFVIHNRVKSIEMLREKLEEIVPEASIIIGHGQMSNRQLERVIGDFTHGNYDVLLATSIIESGIDMPNVNTLIVDRGDWFGMSQLYQIRGRVGRSAQQAYAYFFHAGTKKLTDEARVRLETLAEHTELGAGFQISMRDLELRGAGDILSTKQTGHVATVGLQLYTQLLQQAVSAQKGEPVTHRPGYEQERIVIDLPLPAYIPGDWIQEMALRLQLYRRIGGIQLLSDVDKLRDELRDRFGELPNAVEGLLYQIQVKLLATAISATHVMKPREVIEVRLPWLPHINRGALEQHLGDDVQVTRTAVELVHDDENMWQLRLIDILEALMAALPEEMGV